MPPARIFMLVITVIFFLPLIGGFVLNIAAARYLLEMTGLLRTVSSVQEEERSDFNGTPVSPASAPGLAALRSMDEFEKSRSVRIRVQMKPEDFRRGDPSAATVTDWNGYIASRLPTIGLAECALLTQTLAAKCAVTRIAAEQSETFYDLSMTLSFTQRDAFGAVQPSAELTGNIGQSQQDCREDITDRSLARAAARILCRCEYALHPDQKRKRQLRHL